MMKLSFLLALLLPTTTLAASFLHPGGTQQPIGFWANETDKTYVDFPASVQARVQNEWHIYKSQHFPLPVMRAFQTFPETKVRLWYLLKGMTKRLHPSLWPRVQYDVKEGQTFGCRTNDTNAAAITTAHCHRHCIHQGRYCLPHFEAVPDRYGRNLVKEVVRRLCMDTIYHAKDERYVAYLEEFDAANCLYQQTVPLRNCSIGALHKVGMKWSELKECAAEDHTDQDVPHVVLNRNLRHLRTAMSELHTEGDVDAAAALLPMVTIDKKAVHPMADFDDDALSHQPLPSTEAIFYEYCQAFPSYLEQPLACHICKDCGNVRECLWTLNCDGEAFDPQNIHSSVIAMEMTPHTAPPKDTTKPDSPHQDEIDAQNEAQQEASVMGDALANNNNNNNAQPEEKEDDGHGGAIFWIIFLAFGAFLGTALILYYYANFRHERARKLLDAIAAGKYNRDNNGSDNNGAQSQYRDHPMEGRSSDEDEEDVRDRAQQILADIHEIEQKRESSAGSTDLLDDAVAAAQDQLQKLQRQGDHNDDIPVEDMLDEESEWAEQRHGSGLRTMPADGPTPLELC